MGDKSFESIEFSEKWVCNEAQTAQFGDEFTLVRRKRLAQFAGCICEEAKAAFSGFCWIFLANRSCRSVSGIGEELLSELRPSFVDCQKFGAAHIDFAAHFGDFWIRRVETMWNIGNRLRVQRDIFTDLAVAACCGRNQQ